MEYNWDLLYIVFMNPEHELHVFTLINYLRQNNIACDMDYGKRSFKKQLDEANKRKYAWILIVGDDEIQNNYYTLKCMKTGFQHRILKDNLIKELS